MDEGVEMEQPDVADVHAAGGIVCRNGPAGLVEIAVIHRPSRDDWSLPKGKMDDGESPEQTALREVLEETGLRCLIVRPAASVRYIDRRGRRKTAAYWIMRVLGGAFEPNAEVDQLRWLTVEEALDLLTYANDRHLIAAQVRGA
jgi:8-oxo-dGTP pyrophosphatase MutT (NUDIX family)